MTPVNSKTYRHKKGQNPESVGPKGPPDSDQKKGSNQSTQKSSLKTDAPEFEVLEPENSKANEKSNPLDPEPIEIEASPETSRAIGANTQFSSDLVPLKDRDLLSTYLREMARFPLLTPEQEIELARKSFFEQDREAFTKLVQSNLRFVVKLAFEYSRYGARVLDLIQEGNMGLIKAVKEFDPTKEVKLTTYAVWWIRSYMQDFLLKNWSLVKIGTTSAQKKLFYRLKKEQEKLEREGVDSGPKAIAMNLGVDEADVKLMQERLSGGDVSLDKPFQDKSGESDVASLLSKLPDETPLASSALEEQEQRQLFHKALGEFVKTLEPRDALIFRDRLISETPKTLLEIGEEHGFSKERARQIEERLKDKLKEFLLERYPEISVR